MQSTLRIRADAIEKVANDRLRNSREDQFFVVFAAAILRRACMKVCDRFGVIRCGPSRYNAWDAPAALKNFVRQPEKTFSTASANNRSSRVPGVDRGSRFRRRAFARRLACRRR